MKKILLVMITLMLTLPVMGRTLDEYKAIYEKQIASIEKDASLKSVNYDYSIGLNRIEEQYISQGDVAAVKVIRKEKNRFAITGDVPDKAPEPLLEEIRSLQLEYHDRVWKINKVTSAKKKIMTQKYMDVLKKSASMHLKGREMDKAENFDREYKRVGEISYNISSIPPSLRNGLVLHYDFNKDEGDKVTDLSGKGNHGKVHGAKWKSLSGGRKGLMEFDGKDDILTQDASASVSFDGASFSIALWVEPHSFAGVLFERKKTQKKAEFLHLILHNSNKLRFGFGDADLDTSLKESPKRWMFLVFTYNITTKNKTIYLNSNPISKKTEGTLLTNTNGSKIAMGHGFKGSMDDIMIWNRALSSTEVKQIHMRF